MSKDFNNLTLRNLTAYNADSSLVANGNRLADEYANIGANKI